MVEKDLHSVLILKGFLCEDNCKSGSNVRINDTMHSHVKSEVLEDLLMQQLKLERGDLV